MSKHNHKTLARCGRYTVIRYSQTEVQPFVVACGYNQASGEWGAGFYFSTLRDAMREYNSLIKYACIDCRFRNFDCITCRR